ncbi:hypothetical protein [Hyphococcus sp.]|uniref:hypothetical protein n=1 Tax=Hyphococcus sp. TaxID=2038636 RepID=UPI003D11782B
MHKMIRILLPLAIVAAIFFGPMFAVETMDPVRGKSMSVVTGDYFIGNAVECVKDLRLPLGKECATEGKMNDSTTVGSALTWACVLCALAVVLGIPGLLPVIGRLTSIVTIAAGVASLGALGLFVMGMIGSEAGLGGVQWGAYLAAGLALLTTITGLSGLRGR